MKRVFFIAVLLQGILISVLSLGSMEKANSDLASEVEKVIDWEEDFSESDDKSHDYDLGGDGFILPNYAVYLNSEAHYKEYLNQAVENDSKRHVPLFILHCSLKVDC